MWILSTHKTIPDSAVVWKDVSESENSVNSNSKIIILTFPKGATTHLK
jgi:hypothetical protein